MSNRRFRLVTFLLLLLLIAAVANMLFVYRAYNGAMTAINRGAPESAGNRSIYAQPLEPPAYRAKPGIPFDWNSDIKLVKSPQGGYDLAVRIFQRLESGPLAVDSVEVDIRRPGSDASALTPKLDESSPGKYGSHIDFPSGGTWEIRVRVHRGLQAMEFAEKYDVE